MTSSKNKRETIVVAREDLKKVRVVRGLARPTIVIKSKKTYDRKKYKNMHL